MRFRTSNGLPRIGKRTAHDGAWVEWNLESMPGHITFWGMDATRRNTISGAINETRLARELRQWEKQHPAQLELGI